MRVHRLVEFAPCADTDAALIPPPVPEELLRPPRRNEQQLWAVDVDTRLGERFRTLFESEM